MSNQQKHGGFDMGDYTTQVYREHVIYKHKLQIKLTSLCHFIVQVPNLEVLYLLSLFRGWDSLT